MGSYPNDSHGLLPREEQIDSKTSDISTGRGLCRSGKENFNVPSSWPIAFDHRPANEGKPLWGHWLTWSLPGKKMCLEFSWFFRLFNLWHIHQGMSPQGNVGGQGVPSTMSWAACSSEFHWNVRPPSRQALRYTLAAFLVFLPLILEPSVQQSFLKYHFSFWFQKPP